MFAANIFGGIMLFAVMLALFYVVGKDIKVKWYEYGMFIGGAVLVILSVFNIFYIFDEDRQSSAFMIILGIPGIIAVIAAIYFVVKRNLNTIKRALSENATQSVDATITEEIDEPTEDAVTQEDVNIEDTK